MKMNYFIFFIALVILVSFFTFQKINKSNKTFEMIDEYSEGYSFGLIPDDSYLMNEFATIFTEEESFNGFIKITNKSNKTKIFALVSLLNTEQILFTLDNNTSNIHYLRLLPNEEKMLPVKFIDLPKGTHNLIVFFQAQVETNSTMNTTEALPQFSFVRATLHVKEKTANIKNFLPDITISERIKQSQPRLSGIELVKQTDNGLELYVRDEINGIDPLMVNAHIGNLTEQDLPFTLIPFYNMEQTNIFFNGVPKTSVNGLIEKSSQGIIELYINPKLDGDFFLVLIKNPLNLLEDFPFNNFEYDIISTSRLTLEFQK